jgi:uncharacterized protein
MTEWLLVVAASALAGFVDAVVGGGGLVLVPALFAAYPAAAPATLLGTNKSASVWGTAWATWRYARSVELHASTLMPAIGCAMVASVLGAEVVQRIDARLLKQALPFLLLAVLAYTIVRKDLGRTHAPLEAGRRRSLLAAGIGTAMGFYDGLFGPGAGSFLVFLFVRLLGHDFLHASAHAKVVNLVTNAAALATFAWSGHVMWHLAFALAAANVAGSAVGSQLALTRGAGFVRAMFIVVVMLLVAKTGYDAFVRVARSAAALDRGRARSRHRRRPQTATGCAITGASRRRTRPPRPAASPAMLRRASSARWRPRRPDPPAW